MHVCHLKCDVCHVNYPALAQGNFRCVIKELVERCCSKYQYEVITITISGDSVQLHMRSYVFRINSFYDIIMF